jgi:hypothetical protein
MLKFLGRFPEGIISGFCRCTSLREYLDAAIFVVMEEFFEFLC